MSTPTRPALPKREATIELRSCAKRGMIALDAAQLSAHAAELAEQLKTLGAKAKARMRGSIIRARNDAEGRWIYQQTGGRARATSASAQN